MAVYPHPYEPRVLVAYTFFGSRVPTPRWLDDNENQGHRWIGWLFAHLRGSTLRVISLRYWGRNSIQ